MKVYKLSSLRRSPFICEINAVKFDEISYDEIYNRNLKVMDLTATTMCKENKMPIYVFDMDTVGNLKKVLLGEKIGTLVYV